MAKILLIFLVVLVFAVPSYGQTIITGGKPVSIITYWSKTEAPVAEFAAKELQKYLAKISGAKIPVQSNHLEDSTPPPPNLTSAVVIAPGPIDPLTLSQILCGIDSVIASLKEDSLLIQTMGDKIILVGRNDRGTLYAVYRFLESLRVRFFAPNFSFYLDHNEFVPGTTTVTVPSLNIIEQPSFQHRRKDLGEAISITLPTLRRLIDWMAKNKLNLLSVPILRPDGISWDNFRDQLIPELAKRGMLLEVGGHEVYPCFLPESFYLQDHPDWFDEPYTTIFHVSNQAALSEFIKNGIDYLTVRPEINFLAMRPPEDRWPKSDVATLGAIKNATAYVVQQFKAHLKDTLPQIQVSALSYTPYTGIPAPAYMYDASTVMDFAPYDRSYGELICEPNYPQNVSFLKLIKRWNDSGFQGPKRVYEYYRKYTWHSLPVCLLNLIGQEIPFYYSLGFMGLGMYAEPADWVTYEPIHLLVAALLWNKDLVTPTYLQAYLQRRYGPAMSQMVTYFTEVENAGRALFISAAGDYQNPQAVGLALDNYLKASVALTEASNAATGKSAAFMLDLLTQNISFALADTEISYFTLAGDQTKVKAAKKRTSDLIIANRFKGIILDCNYSRRRFDSQATQENCRWIYNMYRKAFGGIPLPMSTQ